MKSLNLRQKIKPAGKARVFALNLIIIFTLLLNYSTVWGQTPVAANGQLSVSGTELVNKDGNPIQLRGMSTHGIQWYGHCINYDAISTLASDWGADVLRIAVYPDEDGSGWVYDKDYFNGFIDDLVNLTEQFGLYCIIDWHVHIPGDPMALVEEAKEFWELMSSRYANKEHIIYEICNEPNGVDWNRVSEYANQIIPIIRANDPEQIILVGTPTYSQDVDVASQNPLPYDNLLYSLHFYAGTHGQSLRDKANTAMSNGIGLFLTEWGTSSANGDGGPFPDQADVWINWANENNLSWSNWSFCDKEEVSAALVNGSCVGNEWNNTSASGTYVKNIMLNPPDSWAEGDNIPPTATITAPAPLAKYELDDVVTVQASASDQDGAVALVEFYAGETKVGESSNSPYSTEFVASAIGEVELSVTVTDNEGATNNSNIVLIEILEEIVQTAYPDGTPHAVPGEINATYFDVGGEGIAYHDVDATNKGGFNRTDEGVDTESSENGNIGYVVNDEWVEYTINVETAGTYSFEIRVASEPGGGQFHLEFDGVDKTGIQNVSATGGWTSYTTLSIQEIDLAAGEQVMRLFVDVGDFNFATMTFTYTGTSVPPTGVTVSPTELTLEIGTSSDLNETVLPANATNKNVTWSTSNSSIATVNPEGLVTAVNEGSATITVTTQEGSFTASCQVTVNPEQDIDATGVELDITETTIYTDNCIQLMANVLPENATNKNVVWTSSNSAVAAVNSSGQVCGVAAGSAVITVTTEDGGFTSACEVNVEIKPVDQYTLSISYTGEGGSVEINPDQALYIDGAQVTLTALQPDNGYEFTGWSGDASGTDLVITITMDSDKAITANYAQIGECTTISMPYAQNGAADQCLIANGTVTNINSWNMDYVEVNGKDFTNTFANGSEIPTSADGLIHITYQASVAWAHFEISGEDNNGQDVPVTGVSVSPSVASIEINESVTLSETVSPSNATNKSVSWSSSNTSIAVVNSAGVVTGVAEGSAVITVATTDGGFSAQTDISVTDSEVPVTGVSVSPTLASIEINGMVTLSETVSPTNATDKSVSWSSNNTAVATVNGSGVVTGVAEGMATITVSTTDGGFMAQAEINVTSYEVPVTGVSVSPTIVSIEIDETVTLSETVSPTNATDKSVNWSSNNTSVATVNGSGVVTGVAEGIAAITVTTTDGGFTAEAEVTVTYGGTVEPCENPVTVSVPISQDGAGEHCWFTTDDISYVNSWALDVLEINGVDYLNEYSNSLPERIDGGYYIYCVASHGWSHFEAVSLKSVDGVDSFVDVQAYPNPFNESTRLIIDNPELVNSVQVFDQIGKLIISYNSADINSAMEIGEGFESGIYLLRIISKSNEQTIMINKQ